MNRSSGTRHRRLFIKRRAVTHQTASKAAIRAKIARLSQNEITGSA